PPPEDVGVVVGDRVALVVAVPVREADAPAVLDRKEVGALRQLRRADARLPGEPGRRVGRRGEGRLGFAGRRRGRRGRGAGTAGTGEAGPGSRAVRRAGGPEAARAREQRQAGELPGPGIAKYFAPWTKAPQPNPFRLAASLGERGDDALAEARG